VFSAKGAAFMNSVGQRPTNSGNAKPASAEGATHSEARRWIEARFQRLFIKRDQSPWGDAPGYEEIAPTALSGYKHQEMDVVRKTKAKTINTAANATRRFTFSAPRN
jgi:hypothetical protein